MQSYKPNRLLDFLLFSNVFIAICAMAQGALTYLLLNQPTNPHVIALLGTATLFLYNFSMVLSKPDNPATSPHRRSRWIFTHFRLIRALTIVSALALIPLAYNLHLNSLILLLLTGLLALTYSMPIFRRNKRRYGLRGIPGAKLFIISSVWTLSCVALPTVELKAEGIYVAHTAIFLLSLKRFLFITAITIPFDIRDLFQDKQYQLKTIPVVFGTQKANLLCQLLMALHIVLLIIFVERVDISTLGLITVNLLAAWLVFKSSWKKNEYYYFFLLDGTLILQFLSVALLRLV